ncbi:MAG: SRPBCC domain-containing protein [Propionibacteriales bacterium]|nr:SRPBCC domain-containing protein [Propionibacteriales bacterium]
MQTNVQEITSSTEIDAPLEEVWEALTTPSLIKKWFLGVDTETDWKVGSSIVHRGEYEGKPYVDTGEILAFEPPTLLEHSHWSEGSGKPNSPEQYQVVSWALTERSGGTDLKITEKNLPSKEAAETSEQTWKMVLGNLKDLLEG